MPPPEFPQCNRPAATAALLLCLLLTSQCRKNDVAPSLPPETTVGANRAGCLVNEHILVPRDTWGRSGTSLAFRLGTTAATATFSLGISDEQNAQTPLVLLRADSLVLEQGKSYPISWTKKGQGGAQAECIAPGGRYLTTSPGSGTLTITRLDRQANLLAGRFDFVATNQQTGEQVRITHGRFDYQVD